MRRPHERPKVIALEIRPAGLGESALRHHDDVETGHQILAGPEQFADPSLGPVSLDGTAEPPRCGDPEPSGAGGPFRTR